VDDNAQSTKLEDAITNAPDLIRIGAMVQTVASELRQLDVDAAGRERLAELHAASVALVKEAVSKALATELDNLVPRFDTDRPTTSELRLAQAQLVGWLEGLFRGMQVMALQSQRPGPPAAPGGALPEHPLGPGYL
jgi:hypothetical protein